MTREEKRVDAAKKALERKLQKAREEMTEEQFTSKLIDLSLLAAGETQKGGIMEEVIKFVKGNRVAGAVAFLMTSYRVGIIRARELRLCIGRILDVITEDKILEED